MAASRKVNLYQFFRQVDSPYDEFVFLRPYEASGRKEEGLRWKKTSSSRTPRSRPRRQERRGSRRRCWSRRRWCPSSSAVSTVASSTPATRSARSMKRHVMRSTSLRLQHSIKNYILVIEIIYLKKNKKNRVPVNCKQLHD